METLQEGALENPPMAQRFLRIIMMEVDRLTRLINDILSISKMESGQNEVSNERVRIDQMMEDVAEVLSVHSWFYGPCALNRKIKSDDQVHQNHIFMGFYFGKTSPDNTAIPLCKSQNITAM